MLEKLIFVIFIILLKVLMDKDFSYFLPAITRFEGDLVKMFIYQGLARFFLILFGKF